MTLLFRRTRSLFVAGLLAATLAHGHQPSAAGGTLVTVADPKVSWVFVGQFDEGDEVFEFDLDFDEGFAFPVEVLVPHRAEWKDFRPRFAVVGPGLPLPTDDQRALLPRDVPAGMGVFLEQNERADRVVLFEGVLRRMYWTSEAVALAVDAGETQIWVWSPDETAGPFSLGLGVEEDFGPNSGRELLENWSLYAY
jgi:hypothetical protein